MIKPSWLGCTLLFTTALVAPGAAWAQDSDAATPPLSPSEDTAEAEVDAPDVSIPGEIIVTGRRGRDVTRSSDQVVAVLSTEDIARTGEGDIAGALGRVTGLSVVGGGFVYVRGLGDRYSLALLNGLPLPSPEPLRRVVPLDIFPTNVVASSLVQKSYSANFPGEFGGGVINLTTIAVPDETFLSVSAGISGNSETTFETGYSYGGSTSDWTGFDDGRRNIPSGLAEFFASGARIGGSPVEHSTIIGQFADPSLLLLQKMDHVPADWSGSITGGTAFDAGDARVGVVATFSYSNEWRTRDVIQQTSASNDLSTLDDDYRSVNTENRLTLNGLLGFGVELGDHKIRWTNLFIHDTLKQTRNALGRNIGSGYERIVQDTAWFERQLFDTQLVGELRFGDFGLDFRGGYANSKRDAPFETSFEYVKTNLSNDPFGDLYVNRLNNGQEGDATVAFSELDEDLWYGGVDGSVALTPRLSLTAGYSYTDTSRFSTRREFSIIAPGSFPTYVGLLRPDVLLSPNIAEFYDLGLIEDTESDPAFQADLVIHAGYAKLNWEPLDDVSLDIGVRYEDAEQTVSPVAVFTNPIVSSAGTVLKNDYWLPAATLTWSLAPDWQLRLNASKTIARPQFRELLFQLYYDPDANRTFRGNPYLTDSELLNGEVRLEYYLGSNQRISLSGFYKEIDKPIETFVRFGDNGSRGFFANAPKAELYGAELEVQKHFDLYKWGSFFENRRFMVIANYTYTKSKLKVGATDTVDIFPLQDRLAADYFRDGSPLTGQSDHIANLQFGFEDQEKLSQQTILINYASKRVVGRGDRFLPDVIETPGISVDLVLRQGIRLFGIDTEWKAEVRNIFDQDHEEYQQVGSNRIDLNSYDIGRKFSLSISANF